MHTPFFILLSTFFFYLPTLATQDQFPMSTTYYQQLCAPIEFTNVGVTTFLSQIYNMPSYVEVLPNNFCHPLQFLDHGQKTKRSRAYAQSVLRLFLNKLKACSYVNAESFEFFLQELPTLLQPYFTLHKGDRRAFLHEQVNERMHGAFLHKFPEFKRDPSAFLHSLSQELMQILFAEYENDLGCETLRKTTLIFLEISLNKLIWSPAEPIHSWDSVKSISQHLTKLSDNGILTDPDDLNDLLVTLIERYCLFIDLVSTDLPADFYEHVQKDLAYSGLFMFTLEEEHGIETKKERLLRALQLGETKARAYEYMKEQQKRAITQE